MKVNNVSIYMGDDERILRKSEAEKNELNQNQRKMIDGKAFSAAFDPIAAKREEAKEHIDKKAQETKEQAEAKKEKEEELQERIDATKEKKKENEELTEDILEGVADAASNASDVNAAQQEIKDMMNKMSLIEDDIKGAAVDKNV